ncbi:Uu.00g099510.m01.CDS01 [Anthostomella pinea]|uniref:SWR1-complex protein 4 n=1 Tax=Anthostomella pinea TaxID=933095 RepID=A0AAI8VDH3_9PEZI|nr:Uu.00g099510.m01.CDS01 [Anthostomella pinea]
MASHDVRDMLNLPSEGAGHRPAKKQKTSAPRPNLKGLAREVQSLGGDNPIAIVPEISTFKKRRFGSRKPTARWEMRSFQNSARGDCSLHLRHWRKQTDGRRSRASSQPQQDGNTPGDVGMGTQSESEKLDDSGFAKFNVQVDVPQYSEDQYNSNLVSNDWTKHETDYLIELARTYDLRWPLIWDRYEYTPHLSASTADGEGVDVTDPNTAVVPAPHVRNLEDLKRRYYEVAAKMMAVQKPVQYMTQAEFALHEVMANFDPDSETRRKKFALNALSRSPDEAREEEHLLIEVRRIVARQEKLNQERRELYNRLDYPHTEQDISTFKSSAGLQTLLQNMMNIDKSKKRKSLMDANGMNTPASAHPSGGPPGSTPVSESRRESIAASIGGHRDSIGGGERPERPSKKGASQPERKKLSEQEEQIYGVAHYDRLPSGPTFRYERINKILTTKSHAQHQRITNTLTELDIPTRLNMPTRPVVEEMEKLLNAINILLDIRKINDKVDAEIKVEQAKKAERERASVAQAQAQTKSEDTDSSREDKKSDQTVTNGAGAAANDEVSGHPHERTNREGTSTNGATAEAMQIDGAGESSLVKQETGDDKAARPGSSGAHKRSASDLSSVSDNSAKRQKK